MEAELGRESHRFYGGRGLDPNAIGKKGIEWDLNDWRWDGELLIATPVNGAPSDHRNMQPFPIGMNGLPSNSSSSSSEETDFGIISRGKGEAEKRRLVVVEEGEPCDRAGSLSLNLGAHAHLVNDDETNAKRSKLQGSNSNHLTCQVEGCMADLSNSRDYHRRHKVCEMHAKAGTAVVGNAIQRFCQQCSRFHLLQEFDEGKRSCRRRLEGHNKRRRKAHPDAAAGGTSLDDRTSGYLLISLLKILSNLHSDSSEPPKDQDVLSQLLRSLGHVAGSLNAGNLSGLLQAAESRHNLAATAGTSLQSANALASGSAPIPESNGETFSATKAACAIGAPGLQNSVSIAAEPHACKAVLRDFDLNDTYNETEDCEGGFGKPNTPAYAGLSPSNCPSRMLQDSRQSPPQASANSDSTSAQSLSSSNGDTQCRTDRIVFKLFGKDPHDLPLDLRAQILGWLSNSPTDIESYIRPGCVILTIYIRLAESAWMELCDNLSSYLDDLLDGSTDNFWRKGWIYVQVQNEIVVIYNGQVVLDTSLFPGCPGHSKIICVGPVAAPHSSTVNFTVKGFDLAHSSARVLCSFEGKYFFQENVRALAEGADVGNEHQVPECLSFSCSLPCANGRGFIEVNDHGFGSGFFPFIIADQDICSEICVLEQVIATSAYDDHSQGGLGGDSARNKALDFLNELGWLLCRSNLISRTDKTGICPDVFHLSRFRRLLAFAVDHDWCAVVKKLLDILFGGAVDLSGQPPQEIALSENLLHNAVRRSCKSMVETLLKYKPFAELETSAERLLFRPDIQGPSNLTPLHIAAASSGAEGMLDALTDDPGMVGIKAWKSARDSIGLTPEDYAHARGHESYLQMVQKKIDRRLLQGHIVVGIPRDACPNFSDGMKSGNAIFEISKINKPVSVPTPYCNICSQQMACRNPAGRTFLYRPALLTMVGIAAVCVCVGILLKTPPHVYFVRPSFRWELLEYGSM